MPDQQLPDTPLFALLRTIEKDVSVEQMDRIWIFPPRKLEAGETSVVIVAAFLPADPDRRRVYAAHYTVAADQPEARLVLDEFGTAPTERMGRLVEDVLERIKDVPPAPPRAARIEGHHSRWNELLHSLADHQLQEAGSRARARRDPRPRATARNLRPRGRT